MGCTPSHELSIKEAKERLLDAAEELSLSAFIKRRPYAVLMLAFAAGVLVEMSPRARRTIVRTLMRGGVGLL